jgi:hypothetical protein
MTLSLSNLSLMTRSKMTLRILKTSIMTVGLTTFSMIKLSIMKLGITTNTSIMNLSIITIYTITLSMTTSAYWIIYDPTKIYHKQVPHYVNVIMLNAIIQNTYSECHYAECR